MNFSSQEFYDVVVGPNVAAQQPDTGSCRHAVNLSLGWIPILGCGRFSVLRDAVREGTGRAVRQMSVEVRNDVGPIIRVKSGFEIEVLV